MIVRFLNIFFIKWISLSEKVMNKKKWIQGVIAFGFLVLLSPALYADSGAPASPQTPPTPTQQLDQSLTKSAKMAEQLSLTNQDMMKKFDQFCTDIDEIRIRLHRRGHVKHA